MRRSTFALTAVAVAALALVATACGSSSSSSGSSGTTTTAAANPLTGPWTLKSYTADGKESPAAASSPASLTLSDDGTFSGNTGCNQLSGTWTGDVDGAFTITPGPMTQRACVDPSVQAQETALTTDLPKVTDANVSGTTLQMAGSDGVTLLTWERGPDGIEGAYAVTGVNNGNDAVVGSSAAENASITFGADGTVSGNTGCNSFSGTYEVTGTTIVIDGNVAATMMACEPDAQAFEEQFLAALTASATWERSGQQVTLRDGTGATQLTLVASS